MMSTPVKEKQRLKIGKVAINLVISTETKEKLLAMAGDDRRTMTLELEFLIEEEWRRREKNKGA